MLYKADLRVGLSRRVYQACDARIASRRLTKLTSDLRLGLIRTLRYHSKNFVRSDLERFSTIKAYYTNLNTNKEPLTFPNGDPISFADVKLTLVTPYNQLLQTVNEESGTIIAGSTTGKTDRWGNLSINVANNATTIEESMYRLEIPALDVDGDMIYVPLTETGTSAFKDALLNRGHKYPAGLATLYPLQLDPTFVVDIGFNFNIIFP